MNRNTLSNQVIYQIYVRNFTLEGTLKAAKEKLPYIKSLGTDIVYLLPIHPIGVKGRKGTLGSPYAIQDYTRVNPELGTMEDFLDFAQTVHALGMKLMLDVVYNHTSRDSWLLANHPEWFYKDPLGHFGNKAGDWADVYDLDHSQPGLDEYLTDVLVDWIGKGADGFRFDVASLIPTSFFELLRKKIGSEKVLLAECVDTRFIQDVRSHGYVGDSNGELAAAGIDLFYNYGSWEWLDRFLSRGFHTEDLHKYQVALTMEEAGIPTDCAIVRALENHDRQRVASYSTDLSFTHSLLAFSWFTKGPAFVFNGEEVKATHLPSLFDKDTIDMAVKDRDYFDYAKHLLALKKRKENQDLLVSLYPEIDGDVLAVENVYRNGKKEYGLFNLSRKPVSVDVPFIPEGTYRDLISGKAIAIEKGQKLSLTEPLELAKD